MSTRLKNRIFDSVILAVLVVLLIACLAPFLHIVAISLSSMEPIMSGKVSLLPVELTLDAYNRVMDDPTMIRSLLFTIGLTLSFTIICMSMTILTAYPLTKMHLKGRKAVMYMIIFTMFFGGGIIPDYILIKSLHLLNSPWALILPGMISPFNMIILLSFFRSIPESLIESAELDGSSHFGTLFRIVLPLSMPVLATLSLFYAVGRWNGFMDTLFYITNPNLYPLQLKLYQMVMNSMVTELLTVEGARVMEVLPESLKAASIMFATIPILIVYPWLQKYFVKGMLLGSIKG